jgi:hypothetical protein
MRLAFHKSVKIAVRFTSSQSPTPETRRCEKSCGTVRGSPRQQEVVVCCGLGQNGRTFEETRNATPEKTALPS